MNLRAASLSPCGERSQSHFYKTAAYATTEIPWTTTSFPKEKLRVSNFRSKNCIRL